MQSDVIRRIISSVMSISSPVAVPPEPELPPYAVLSSKGLQHDDKNRSRDRNRRKALNP